MRVKWKTYKAPKECWLLVIVVMFRLHMILCIEGRCSVRLFAFTFNLNSIIVSVIRGRRKTGIQIGNSKKKEKEKLKPLLWLKVVITSATTFRTNWNSFGHPIFDEYNIGWI